MADDLVALFVMVAAMTCLAMPDPALPAVASFATALSVLAVRAAPAGSGPRTAGRTRRGSVAGD